MQVTNPVRRSPMDRWPPMANRPAARLSCKAMQLAVLKHAKDDEEANLYPKLQQAMDANKNAMLTAAYRREFSNVKQA